MSFLRCCSNRNMWPYNLLHSDNIKTEYGDFLLECIWHLPEVPSYQAEHDTVFQNDAYDSFLIELLKEKLSITDDDMLVVSDGTKNPTIDSNVAKYYENEICTNCNKVVIGKSKNKTTIQAFFSHLRDIIAHGCFTIEADMFIGFNHPVYGGDKYTAVIKIKIGDLMALVESFADMTDISSIFSKCLEKIGYQVPNINLIHDSSSDEQLFAEKDGKKYFLVFRHFSGRYAAQIDIEKFVNEYRNYDKTDSLFILVIDSTYSTKELRAYLVGQKIAVIDKSSLKKLMSGEDVLESLYQESQEYNND